jgi:predicted O-methyltransferase YrrM
MTRFSNEHTLLWKEEPDCLASWADAVPDGGRILEIGTAEGGSARIMDKVVAGRGVSICTVDLAPSEKAAELLSSTSVKMVKAPSASFAKSWSEADRIDLLFIDGDHSFKGIYEDFVSWAPFLSSADASSSMTSTLSSAVESRILA